MKKQKKRDAILYVKITKENKDYLEKQKNKFGYETLSIFVNDMVSNLRKKVN